MSPGLIVAPLTQVVIPHLTSTLFETHSLAPFPTEGGPPDPIAWRSLPFPYRRGSLPGGGFSAGRGERSAHQGGGLARPYRRPVDAGCHPPSYVYPFRDLPPSRRKGDPRILSRGVRYPFLIGKGPCLAVVFRQAGGIGLRIREEVSPGHIVVPLTQVVIPHLPSHLSRLPASANLPPIPLPARKGERRWVDGPGMQMCRAGEFLSIRVSIDDRHA